MMLKTWDVRYHDARTIVVYAADQQRATLDALKLATGAFVTSGTPRTGSCSEHCEDCNHAA
jgi:hypothetical protein